MEISQSVGLKAPNYRKDVMVVQTLLNRNVRHLLPYQPLVIDGFSGPLTIGMIKTFQARHVDMQRPDGRVDPNGKTLKHLKQTKISSSTDQSVKAISFTFLQAQQAQIKFKYQQPVPVDHLPDEHKQLTETDYLRAANILGLDDVNVIKAVAHVESRGQGFLSNGKAKILFEGHIFHVLLIANGMASIQLFPMRNGLKSSTLVV